MATGDTEDQIVNSLADGAQFVPAIRSAVEKGLTSSVLPSLDRFADRRQRDIQTVCNHNYVEFINSVQEVLKMRADVVKLKGNLEALNSEVQRTGREALTATEALETHIEIRRNIDEAAELVVASLKLVIMASAIKQQLSTKNFYGALKLSSDLRARVQTKQHPGQRVLVGHISKWLAEVERTIPTDVLAEFTLKNAQKCASSDKQAQSDAPHRGFLRELPRRLSRAVQAETTVSAELLLSQL
jgi:hypothetical protein